MFSISREKALEIRNSLLSSGNNNRASAINTAADLNRLIRASDNPFKKVIIREDLQKRSVYTIQKFITISSFLDQLPGQICLDRKDIPP